MLNNKLRNPRRGFISVPRMRKETKSLSEAKGFTLVELLVVISIIGILATIGVATYSRAQMRARDAKRKADMVTIQNALEMYASENNGNYPSHGTWAKSTDADPWIHPGLCPTYIKTIPKETHHTNWPYHYANNSWTQGCTGGYILLMHMETEDGKSCSCGWYGGHWDCYESP